MHLLFSFSPPSLPSLSYTSEKILLHYHFNRLPCMISFSLHSNYQPKSASIYRKGNTYFNNTRTQFKKWHPSIQTIISSSFYIAVLYFFIFLGRWLITLRVGQHSKDCLLRKQTKIKHLANLARLDRFHSKPI